MKKRGFFVLIMIFLFLVIIGICYFVKGAWREAMSTYGPLNMMETDDLQTVKENHSTASFSLPEKKDVYLSGNARVNKGTASFVISFNGEKIFEDSFGEGDNQINTEVIKDKDGEVTIEIMATDDVQGDYSIAVYTRERVLNRLIRRLKENL